MSTTLSTPPPPFPLIYGGATFPPPYSDTSPPPPQSSSSSSSFIIIVTVLLTLVIIISAIVYLRRKHLSKHHHRSFTNSSNNAAVLHREASTTNRHVSPNLLLDSLPVFTFRSLTGNLTGDGDCAVCLSKFKPNDKLRLLPLCCHAFHATCIDAWIVSNQTCPLCRSTVALDDNFSSSTDNRLNNNVNENNNNVTNNNSSSSSSSNSNFRSDQRNMSRGGSYRVQIGSISTSTAADAAAEGVQRSYSIGNGSSSLEYVLEGNGYEVNVDKDVEVYGGGSRSLVREYLERLTSISMSTSRSTSFRSSRRFFSCGSSRRSEAVDLEANREAGEEISEMFRWLSEI